MISTKASAENVVHAVLDLIGLGDFEVRIVQRAPDFRGDMTLEMALLKTLPLPACTDIRTEGAALKAIPDAMRPIRDAIVNSSEVKTLVADLEKRLAAAEEELAEIRPYKAHFDVEMKLRHGEGQHGQ